MQTYSKIIQKTSKKPLLIEFNNISVNYGDLVALENVNFKLHKNDFLYIVGPNGGGKSTLVKTILGLVKPKSGNITNKVASVGYLPQLLNRRTSFPITVSEVIYSGFLKQRLFISKKDQLIIDNWLLKMDLVGKKDEMMGNLSGGQQQRVFLIRALISNPELLILDEPTSALDPNFRKHFYDLITELNNEGTTIIFITHDVSNELNPNSYVMEVDRKIECFDSLKSFNEEPSGGHHHV